MNTTTKKLEIGPGPKKLGNDWITADCRPGSDYLFFWGIDRLPCEDGTFDLIYSSHCLEHVPWFNTKHAIAEVFRLLKPGGTFRVHVPNFAFLVECYQDRIAGDDWRRHNPSGDPMLWLNGRIFTYGPQDPNWHRSVFDQYSLADFLREAGFINVQRIEDRPLGHDHGRIDLGMTGEKL